MRCILLVALLALLISGCVKPKPTGYLIEEYPLGSEMDVRVQLVNKELCIFGSPPFFIKVQDTEFCKDLGEKNYYRLEGMIVEFEEDKYVVRELTQTDVTSAMKSSYTVSVSVPVVYVGAKNDTDLALKLLTEVKWRQENLSKDVPLVCSSQKYESKLEVSYGYGISGTMSFFLPADREHSFSLNLTDVTYGTYDIAYKTGAKRRFRTLFLRVSGIPESYKMSDLDNFVSIKQSNYFCTAYQKIGSTGYYSCNINEDFDFSDLRRITLSAQNKTFFCSGGVLMKNQTMGAAAR